MWDAFLRSIGQASTNPLALVAYLALVLVFGLSTWRNAKINSVLKALSGKSGDEIAKVLQTADPQLQPPANVGAEFYLKYKRGQNRLMIVLAVLVTTVILAALVAYHLAVREPLKAEARVLTFALDNTRIAISKARSNDYRRAVGDLEVTLKAHPSANGYMHLGFMYDELSETDKAAAAYRRVTELDPQDARGWNNLGMMAIDSGAFADGEKHLRRAVELAGQADDIRFLALGNIGNIRFREASAATDPRKREELYRKALTDGFEPALVLVASSPGDAESASLYSNLATAYAGVSDLPKARKYIDLAVALRRKLAVNKSLWVTRVNEAEIAIAEGKLEEARQSLNEALPVFDSVGYGIGRAAVHLNLGRIAARRCQSGDAEKEWTTAREIFLQSGAQAYVDELDRLRRDEKCAKAD